MKTKLIFLFTLVILSDVFTLNGQDLSNFTRLESKGEIPQDFLTRTSEKITTELEANTNEDLDERFFASSRITIDELLLSGQILFNEPLSIYLNKVVNYTLKGEEELKSRLRFYILKSNDINAYSTDQGIIFFTTGLLAQLENEAQLAFIIAHEASHYILNHVREGYIETKKIVGDESNYMSRDIVAIIKQLSSYHKENELAADEKGIEIYLKTDYAVEEIYTSFEMLLYSYLPFNEKKFDTTFFNTAVLQIPGILFPDTINQISIDGDYDDENHTHPNIQTRIDMALDVIGDNNSNGELKYKISESEFLKIRNLARFEGINLLLAEREYGKVLYNIFLLEKEFPNNRFLDLSKVKALYGLAKYKNAGRYNEVTEPSSEFEGESYALHHFLKIINREALNVIAYRFAYDMRVKYKNQPTFVTYEKEMKKEFALNSTIDFKSLKALDFNTFNENLSEERKRVNNYDSILKIDDSELSKYEKIQVKLELAKMKENLENFKEWIEVFYMFGLADIVSNGKFVKELEGIVDAEKNLVRGDNDQLLDSETAQQKEKVTFEKVVIVDPYIVFNSTKVDYEENEEDEEYIVDLLSKDYSTLNLDKTVIDSRELHQDSVCNYNEIGLLHQWMQEVNLHRGINMISSSNDLMQELQEKYGTEHFVFSWFVGSKFKKTAHAGYLLFLFVWPLAPFAVIDLLVVRKRMDIVVISVNSTTDQFEFIDHEDDLHIGMAGVLSSEIYDILEGLQSH